MPGMQYGRFRIVPSVKKGKVSYQIKVGNIIVGEYGSKGKAALETIKLDRAERKTKEAVMAIKDTGIKFGNMGVGFGKQFFKAVEKSDSPLDLVGNLFGRKMVRKRKVIKKKKYSSVKRR